MFSIKFKSFPAEIPILMREHKNGMYRILPYYLSKILVDVINSILNFKSDFALFYLILAAIFYYTPLNFNEHLLLVNIEIKE
jgi:hypothetical protein